jgi:transcriptional regulator with XRE-family HTH domain
MSDGGNPAVQSRRLRGALRDLRAAAGLTQEQVATDLDWSLSKVVRIESGAVKISVTDLMALLREYELSEADRIAELVAMAKEARMRPWWSAYGDSASKRYLEFVEFEQAAEATLHYQPLFVPGTLQTRDYATAIIGRLARDVTEAKAKGLLDFRMRRQQLLDSAEPPCLSFVLDESVLLRRVGTSEVMAGQLDRLIELAAQPNLTIQVYPFSAGLTYGMQTPFVIHQFPDDPDVLYMEGPRGDTLVDDDEAEISRYRRAFDELQRMSLSTSDSVEFIKNLADQLR